MATDYAGHVPDGVYPEPGSIGWEAGVRTPELSVRVRDRNGAFHTRQSWEMYAADRGVPPYDHNDRPNVVLMGSDDKLTEVVTSMRNVLDAIQQFNDRVLNNPMMKNMMGL